MYSICDTHQRSALCHNIDISKNEIITAATGNRIKKYRLLAGLKQEELSKISGVHRTHIIKLENNMQILSLDICNKLAKALNIKPEILMNDYLKFISSNYGQAIKESRTELKLTRENLSILLGVHVGTIKRWENNEAAPSRDNFNLINRYMNFKY